MFKFFKDWYESHLTDPNQVALALIILSITLITYILLSTVAPILVAIVLAYMLEGVVGRINESNQVRRESIVLIVYVSFLAIAIITLFLLVRIMLDQLTLLIKTLPSMLERGKILLLDFTSNNNNFISEAQLTQIFSTMNSEISVAGRSLISYSFISGRNWRSTAAS